MRTRTALAFLLLMALPAEAACHRHKIWHYPWPQCSSERLPRVALRAEAPKTPIDARTEPSTPPPVSFAKRWSDAAADAVQRNLTPACGNDHCTIYWIAKDGSLIVMSSYTDGSKTICTDWGLPTIECLKSDGTKEEIPVK